MRLLLDTHAVLWALTSPGALSAEARAAIVGAEELRLSVVSPWELAIKAALGKITLHHPVESICAELQREFGAAVLPVTLEHVLAVGRLPLHHGDLFDRLLIAQAQVERLVVVTRDRSFAAYGIPTVEA
ncbi:MAG: type II toxin-antitoxin system VapC family toxin [Myxococcota bacterium]